MLNIIGQLNSIRDLLISSATASELTRARKILIDLQHMLDEKIKASSSPDDSAAIQKNTRIIPVEYDLLLKQLHEAQEDLALSHLANKALLEEIDLCYQSMQRSSRITANLLNIKSK